MVTFSHPADIEQARVLTLRTALRIEVRTGLRHSRVTISNLVRDVLGTRTRTKKKLLDELDRYIADHYGM